MPWRILRGLRPPPRRGYDAFISYSRQASEPLAEVLERGLELIARPWYRIGGLRIFRDRTGLGATPDLRKMLFDHIRASNFLVLLASNQAAQSPWVDLELRHWFETLRRPADKAIVVLNGGDMPRWDHAKDQFDPATTASLPPAYLQHCRSEPAFVDMRWVDQKKPAPTLKDARFLDQVADIATPLLGKSSKDEVISDELKRRKNVRTVVVVAALVLVALGGAIYRLYDTQSRIGRSEAWAKRAGELTRNNPDHALLFAAAAADAYATDNAMRALLTAAFRSAGLAGIARGHVGPVETLQFTSPTTLISADNKGEVRQWRIDAGNGVRESAQPRSFRYEFPPDDTGKPPKVQTVIVIPPNGQWLLAVNSAESQEDTISANKVELVGLAGSPPPTPPDIAEAFGYLQDTIRVSPDSKVLTFFGGNDELKRWTVGTGEPAQATTVTEPCYDHRAVSRDGSIALCAGFVDEPLAVWDLAGNRKIGDLPLAEDEDTYIMVLSEDGSVMAKPAPGGLRVAPTRPAARIRERTIPLEGDIRALAFSASGKLLAAALTSGRLLILRLAGERLEPIASVDMGNVQTTSLAFSPDDGLLAAGMKSGVIEIWDVEGQSELLTRLTGSGAFAGLAVSSDENRVAIASTVGDAVRVETRDLATGAAVGKPAEFGMPFLGLGFVDGLLKVIGKGPEGEQCPAVGTFSTMIVATVDPAGTPGTEIVAPATRCDLTGAQPAPKGVITTAENGVALWREDTDAWMEIWNQPQTLFTNPELTASADGTRLAFVPWLPWAENPPIKVEVWSLLDGIPRLLASLDQTTPQLSLFLSGDGSVVAVRTDARIDLWRIDAEGSATLLGAVDIGSDKGPAALDSTGGRLAVARHDGAIELWETKGPRLFGTIPAPAPPVPAAFLAFPGNYLIAVDEDGSTRRFDARPVAWMQHACGLIQSLQTSDAPPPLLGAPVSKNLCPSRLRGS